MKLSKPKIVVSKCLEFDACRYNGLSINDSMIRSLKEYVEFIPVCPEVEIGLGTPRDPIRLIYKEKEIKLVQPFTKKDMTIKMKKFSDEFVNNLGPIDGFILKNESPSCGIYGIKVYDNIDKPSVKFKDQGLFAKSILNHFSNFPVEEEGRLKNKGIREHFFTAIFAIANFRDEVAKPTRGKLIEYHSKNKYLFMMYNQIILKKMGKLLASLNERKIDDTVELYFEMLKNLFSRKPNKRSVINVHMHALGYFSKDLNSKEKKYFLNALEKLRTQIITISGVNSILESWMARYDQPYLSKQTFFQPFPQELIDPLDSGKGSVLN